MAAMRSPNQTTFNDLVEQLAAANRRIETLAQDDQTTKQLAEAKRRIEILEQKNEIIGDENASLRAAARSYKLELDQKTTELEKSKALQNETHRDEIAALKAEARSYQSELETKTAQISRLEEQHHEESWVREVGSEVRLRWLDHRRMRLGKRQNRAVADRIKSGDRAAHRGRPLVDAWLYKDAQIQDGTIYEDLYGVTWEKMLEWKDITEIVELCGFRASLQNNNKLSTKFEEHFRRLLELVGEYETPGDLKQAFRREKVLQKLEHELQDCFDGILAEGPLFTASGGGGGSGGNGSMYGEAREGIPSRSRPRGNQPTAAAKGGGSGNWDSWPN